MVHLSTCPTSDLLKAEGFHRDAGALAYFEGRGAEYGCHYGMRSERDAAAAAFRAGYLDAVADRITIPDLFERVRRVRTIATMREPADVSRSLRRLHTSYVAHGTMEWASKAAVEAALTCIAPYREAGALVDMLDGCAAIAFG